MDEYIKRETVIVELQNLEKESGYARDIFSFDQYFAIRSIPAEDVAPVRHLNADDVYEPFYQWLGEESVSRKWETLRELIDALVESCGAKMDEEGKE